jgi:stage II sporulation protein D
MKAALALWLLLLTVSAAAQQRMFQVRLFWRHPPRRIRVISQDAVMRPCESCPATRLAGMTIEISNSGSMVSAGSISSSTIVLSGRLRIEGNDFAPFSIDNRLQVQARDGFLLLTTAMTLEQYVTAVLEGEGAGFRSEEGLKAMAVAARTYAVHFGSRHRAEGFDFCDTTHCQHLRLENPSPRIRAAVATTEGELMWFEGRPAATFYHRSCGGEIEAPTTLDPDLHAPYLRRHHDDYCVRNADEWESEISKADLSRALGVSVNGIKIVSRSDSGRVRKLLVNDRSIPAIDFRLAIGRTLGWDKLRSDLYEGEDLGDRVSFHGRGQGHGVGLCQAGADAMGQEGHSYREILAYYYPGTRIGLTTQGLAWKKLPGESFDLITTNQADASILIPAAERALRFATGRTGWDIAVRPQIRVYPTIAIYRDATGEPGWVAASTLGEVVRLQPIATLQRTGSLDSILRHEFLHLIIEAHAAPDAPLWLREGLAVYLSNPDSVKPGAVDLAVVEQQLHSSKNESEMRAAYRACASAVGDAVQKNGLPSVLVSLSRSGQ